MLQERLTTNPTQPASVDQHIAGAITWSLNNRPGATNCSRQIQVTETTETFLLINDSAISRISGQIELIERGYCSANEGETED